MSDLSEVVAKNLRPLSVALENGELKVVDQNDDCCIIRSASLSLTISADIRNGLITSRFSFLDADEEDLFTHIVRRLFTDMDFREARSNDLDERVGTEIYNLAEILRKIRQLGLTGRELYYFQRGYNAAYTDYASGQWDSQ